MASPETSSHADRATAGKRRFLYADDMPELRDLMEIILGHEGHEVACVCNGQEAFDQIRAEPHAFDIVITDHHMPMMNGLEFVQNLRESAFSGKIIVFSSELSPEVNEAYHRLQVNAILPKPIYPHVLRSALATL